MTKAWSIVIIGVLSIVMTSVMELCDDKAVEHFDGRAHEALG